MLAEIVIPDWLGYTALGFVLASVVWWILLSHFAKKTDEN